MDFDAYFQVIYDPHRQLTLQPKNLIRGNGGKEAKEVNQRQGGSEAKEVNQRPVEGERGEGAKEANQRQGGGMAAGKA